MNDKFDRVVKSLADAKLPCDTWACSSIDPCKSCLASERLSRLFATKLLVELAVSSQLESHRLRCLGVGPNPKHEKLLDDIWSNNDA